LLIGLALVLRRSELAALTVADLDFVDVGMTLDVARSKADQEAAGQIVGVVATGSPTCPVAALRSWLEAAGITDGAVFRAVDRHGWIATGLSGRAIALIVKRRAAAGVDPTGYSAHSLRAGCATKAAARGEEEHDIGRHTRHRSIPVLRGYIWEGTVFVNNGSARLGLCPPRRSADGLPNRRESIVGMKGTVERMLCLTSPRRQGSAPANFVATSGAGAADRSFDPGFDPTITRRTAELAGL
jgi:hypothetical protein